MFNFKTCVIPTLTKRVGSAASERAAPLPTYVEISNNKESRGQEEDIKVDNSESRRKKSRKKSIMERK